jgi:hypothetical protein
MYDTVMGIYASHSVIKVAPAKYHFYETLRREGGGKRGRKNVVVRSAIELENKDIDTPLTCH